MSINIQGSIISEMARSFDTDLISSAFWGQSFVTELTRISEHSAEKFHAKKASFSDNNSENGEPSNGVETPAQEQVAQ